MSEQAVRWDLPRSTEAERSLTDRFVAWLDSREGREAYLAFVRFAREARACGASRVGGKAIWERMRWELVVDRGKVEEYALNNSYVSRMVRVVEESVPELRGMFETRKLRSE